MEWCKRDKEMERGTLVIDASVAVKWFNTEEYSDIADKLKNRHVRGEIVLVTPVLLLFEVANALRYNPDFESEDVEDAIKDLLDLQIKLFMPEEWMSDAVKIAYTYGTTIYDASYVALSLYLRTIIYTADENFLRKVSNLNVKHITEVD